MNNSASIRAQFRVLATALWGALTATLLFAGVNLPEYLIVAWAVLYTAAIGVGEAWYDSRAEQRLINTRMGGSR